jgi:hypothetical protein
MSHACARFHRKKCTTSEEMSIFIRTRAALETENVRLPQFGAWHTVTIPRHGDFPGPIFRIVLPDIMENSRPMAAPTWYDYPSATSVQEAFARSLHLGLSEDILWDAVWPFLSEARMVMTRKVDALLPTVVCHTYDSKPTVIEVTNQDFFKCKRLVAYMSSFMPEEWVPVKTKVRKSDANLVEHECIRHIHVSHEEPVGCVMSLVASTHASLRVCVKNCATRNFRTKFATDWNLDAKQPVIVHSEVDRELKQRGTWQRLEL